MGGLLKPFATLSPRRSIPNGRLKIDWSHPLARGLIGCWVPGVMGGVDLTGTCPDMTFASGQTIGMEDEGPMLRGGNSGENVGMYCLAPPAFKNWTSISLYYRAARVTKSGAQQQYPFYISYAAGVVSPYAVVGISNPNTNDFNYGWEYNRGGSQTTATFGLQLAGASPVDVPLNMLVTYTVGGTNRSYQNGVARNTNAWVGGAPTSTSTSKVELNGWNAFVGSRVSRTDCLMACAWDRELSADEAIFLDQNPYAFLLPAEEELPALFLPVGGTNATATGSTVTVAASLIAGAATGVRNATAAGATIVVAGSLVSGTATGIRNATASGVVQTAAASLISGTASGASSSTANGATLSTAASIISGSATGVRNATASGATITSAASLIAGSASGAGAATALGATLPASASLIAGSATGIRNGAAAGSTITAASSLIAGTASSNASGTAAGATIAASASIIPGSATGGQIALGVTLPFAASIISGIARGNAVAQGSTLICTATIIWPANPRRRATYGFRRPPPGPTRHPNLSVAVKYGS